MGQMLSGASWFSGVERKNVTPEPLDAKVAALTDVPVDIAFKYGELKLLENAVGVVGTSVVKVRE